MCIHFVIHLQITQTTIKCKWNYHLIRTVNVPPDPKKKKWRHIKRPVYSDCPWHQVQIASGAVSPARSTERCTSFVLWFTIIQKILRAVITVR